MSGLRRRLGRIDALAITLGGVIGVGVFRNTGLVLSGTGGFLEATALWLAVGVVCMAGAVLYADMSARVPEAGGPYAYVRVAFGRPAAFIYGWMNGGISMPLRQASVMAVIGEVIASELPGQPRMWSVGLLIVLAAIHLLGVRVGAIAQRIFTSGKLATIVLVIGLSFMIGPDAAAAGPVPKLAAFVTALGACWYTYLGWQDVVLLAEELHEPRRDLPFVLVGTVLGVIVLYTSIHAAVYYALGDAAYSALPARDVALIALGAFGGSLLSVLMLSSMVGGAAEAIMVRPRIAMALARDGLAPSPIAAIDQRGTPYGAILFHCSIALVLILTGTYTELLTLLTFVQGFLGLFESASYFAVRRAHPELPTSRFHPWAPLVFVAAAGAMFVLAAIAEPLRAGMATAVIAAIGVIYLLLRRRISRREARAASALPTARVIERDGD